MLTNWNYNQPVMMSRMSAPLEGEQTSQPEYDTSILIGKTAQERTEIIRTIVQQKIADRIAANQSNQ